MTTEPLDEQPRKPLAQTAFRFEPDLLTAIDKRARSVNLNRNAWVAKALEWVLTYLPTGLAHPERDRVATDAPDDVAGPERLLATPATHVHKWDREGAEKICHDCGEVRKVPPPPASVRPF